MTTTAKTFDEFMKELEKATYQVDRENVGKYIGIVINDDIYVSMNKDMCTPGYVGTVNLVIKRKYTPDKARNFPLQLSFCSPKDAYELIKRITNV